MTEEQNEQKHTPGDIAKLKRDRDDLLEYAKAEELKSRGGKNPWGHRCFWCGECNDKLRKLRRAAIAKAEDKP